MTSNCAIELRHVDKIFHTRHFFTPHEDTGVRHFHRKKVVHAVDDVSFTVESGQIFGLLGRNGAGKTTTVKMISGLIRPTSGAVYVDGLHVETKRLEVLRKIGVVLEGTRTCIWPLTPLENLAYFGNLRDVRGKVLRKRSRELLEFIGLKDKMNVQVRRLSRGQKQKLAVCIALITDPPVLLLDEPTTGLDVQSSRSIKDKIIEMTRTQGKCVLVTTHDMSVAQELCDRIGIIDGGKLITCRSTGDLLDVFSDLDFEIRLDRLPDLIPLQEIPGVLQVEPRQVDGEAEVLVRVSHDPELRSRALFSTMQYLNNAEVRLRSITQRQQTLEEVFLRLTSGSSDRSSGS
ncbi:MAG: ABC transporter ATP-binding protein [Candidatus Hydrogenedentes bacterium]|nr:ABC transporter ATP-binding protein [Candidatus Hydrogenedentota bacterium]